MTPRSSNSPTATVTQQSRPPNTNLNNYSARCDVRITDTSDQKITVHYSGTEIISQWLPSFPSSFSRSELERRGELELSVLALLISLQVSRTLRERVSNIYIYVCICIYTRLFVDGLLNASTREREREQRTTYTSARYQVGLPTARTARNSDGDCRAAVSAPMSSGYAMQRRL